jgi:hypothetical protein
MAVPRHLGAQRLEPAETRACPERGSRPARLMRLTHLPSVGAMTYDIDIAALIEEIRRYLAAVDAFRAAGCEPTWQAHD